MMWHRCKSRVYRADSGRLVAPSRAAHRANADYTLAHAGRQIRLGPVTFWIAVGTLVIMAGWSLATGTYFAFHDDVIKRLIARQADMQFAYEDRIAELRVQIDRLTSRQLLDQEQIEHKLDQMLRRQAILESRALHLNGLTEQMTTGSIRLPLRGPQIEPLQGEPSRPSAPKAPPAQRQSHWERPAPGGVGSKLARLEEAIVRHEARQAMMLTAIEESYDAKLKRMRGVLADLGLDAGKAAGKSAALGGPFVPVALPADAGAFERQIYRINLARSHAEWLMRTLTALPVRNPLTGELDISSGFGIRIDPFVHGPAMHTGVDLRGEMGEPVHATAAGTVTTAGWYGGYGKMVEIDHGNGISTRYGHLSQISVKVGQTVRVGQLVGRIGSTGRSTGPHLHYETRIEGEAADPQKFLRAGRRLGSAL